MQLSYRLISQLAAILCFILFATLLLFPELIYFIFTIEGNETADLMSRRAAMLFLGVATITFFTRNAASSDIRASICLGLTIMMLGLAVMGLFEFVRGAVGFGIWLAILTEIAFAAAYFALWKRDRT